MKKERAIWIYTTMLKIRRFEETALQLFEENKLRGSVHLYIGEEAVAATVCSQMEDADYITSTHRGHGHCIAKGAALDRALAELMGKETGYCKGRGGSMHIADLEKGNLGANAIVGGGAPIATGGALAQKMRGDGHFTVCFFGDGASNQGVVHEALNLAAVWKLPVIFVCENNGYGISVPVGQSTSVKEISVRAAGYGIPGVTVDGNDVPAIDKALEKAVARAKNGEGPSYIECVTYRLKGHWTGDPEPYRERREVADWAARDPIPRFAAYLQEKKLASAEELDRLKAAVAAEMEAAVVFALASPEPDVAGVMDDVFYEVGQGVKA